MDDLTAATSGRQQSPKLLQEQKRAACAQQMNPTGILWGEVSSSETLKGAENEECNRNQPQRKSFKVLSWFWDLFQRFRGTGVLIPGETHGEI